MKETQQQWKAEVQSKQVVASELVVDQWALWEVQGIKAGGSICTSESVVDQWAASGGLWREEPSAGQPTSLLTMNMSQSSHNDHNLSQSSQIWSRSHNVINSCGQLILKGLVKLHGFSINTQCLSFQLKCQRSGLAKILKKCSKSEKGLRLVFWWWYNRWWFSVLLVYGTSWFQNSLNDIFLYMYGC